MKRFLIILIFSPLFLKAQNDSGLVKRTLPDTSKLIMNADAVFNRPFLSIGKFPMAIGGYLEANTQYEGTDGVNEGFSFQFRRLTLFFSSTITKRIKFLSEIEFEDGTKEINIEYAAMDLELHPLFNLRGGIIMNPIGAFNQNHDGPRWDFIDRPLSATTIIPSTLSNVGFGFHGRVFAHNLSFAYEAYLTNGFDDHIIDNEDNRTSLRAGKSNPEKFEESNSGIPMTTAKIALKHRMYGEVGFSYLGGVYNKWRLDGVAVDAKRQARIYAFDLSTTIANQTRITGELAFVHVEVPEAIAPQFGSHQRGFFVDVVQPIYRNTILKFPNALINACFRVESADYNMGKFHQLNTTIGDDVVAIVPGISFRPSAQTVIRFNYRYQWQHDFIGNPAARTAAIQFGFSSYF
jgi:hypothetical protein